MELLRSRSTHSERLERWLGSIQVEELSKSFKGWYGPPVPLMGVPGGVHIQGGESGGDFVGPIDGGWASNVVEFAEQRRKAAFRRWAQKAEYTSYMGMASLGDLISEATAGKKRLFNYQKVGVAGVVSGTSTLWYEGNAPTAGSVGGAAPGGTEHTSASAGTFPFANPTGGDTQHLTRWDSCCNIAGNTLMLYDRLFSVAKTMNSSTAEAVTGTPSRYQNASGNPDAADGNFFFIECTSALPATAHSWTVTQYVDQAGSGQNAPSLTGNASCIAKRLDHPLMTWFAPLASGSTGLKSLTQIQCSAAVASGAVTFVIGHPIGVLAHPAINTFYTLDGVTGGFNLNRVFDNACLAFLEIIKPATTATTYTGLFETVSG